MSIPRSYILVLIFIFFALIQGAGGIEVTLSANDMSIESHYDVDDSISVDEEAAADVQSSEITDYRKVRGEGHIHADQYFIAPSYRGMACAHTPLYGGLSGSASLTPTVLHAWQTAHLEGPDIWAFMEGSQAYLGSGASTYQETAAEDGVLSTTQGLTMGTNIYSSQDSHAEGYNIYSVGTAGLIQKNEGFGNFKGQGALAGVAAIAYPIFGDPYGTIDVSLNAQVVKTLDYVDPAAYGNIRATSGSIAFGGALAGDIETDMAKGKIDASGAAALTGVAAGELEADVGAQSEKSQSSWIDGDASGLVALQGAAAGNVDADLAKQKANINGAIIGSASVMGDVGGSMRAIIKSDNQASVQGSDVYATGLLASGLGIAAGDLEAKWKNGFMINGVEGSAAGAGGILESDVYAENMRARTSKKGTVAEMDGLSVSGAIVGMGAIAYDYDKDLANNICTTYSYAIFSGGVTNGRLKAKTGWDGDDYLLKAKGEFDSLSASGTAFAGTTGPKVSKNEEDQEDFNPIEHVEMSAKKYVGGKGKADVAVI